jgi:hypothetical protein
MLPGLKATASIRNGGMGDGLYDFALSISHIAGSIVVSTCRHVYRLCVNSGGILILLTDLALYDRCLF